MGAQASTVCVMDIIFQLLSLEAFVPDSSSSRGNKQNVMSESHSCLSMLSLFLLSYMPKILPKTRVLNFLSSTEFYFRQVCVLPPDCDKYLKYLKSFLKDNALIFGCTIMQSSLLVPFPSQDLYTFSLGLCSSSCQLSSLS